MTKICRWCQKGFEIFPEDLAFYEKVSPVFEGKKYLLPPPSLCPDCRHQSRGLFHPRMIFYNRKSDYSGKDLVSMYKPSTLKVYADSEWWSDGWQSQEYGHDFDFLRTFFEQFRELYLVVPKLSNASSKSENCDYSCRTTGSKNAYYSMSVHSCENIYYCNHVSAHCSYLTDCSECFESSWLYDCYGCFHCNNSISLVRCKDTRDAYFSVNCNGCSDILFCSNLRNASFQVYNKPVTKEEFLRVKNTVLNGSHKAFQEGLRKFQQIRTEAVYNHLNNNNTEDCVGDDLTNCARCHECYNCINTVDGRYMWDMGPNQKNIDSMDVTKGGIGELLYNCASLGGGNYHMLMCFLCRYGNFLIYCIDCYSCQNCFGCVGLKNAEYCIFNKQYSKREYELLVPRIIEHMRKTGEWGEFFTPGLSLFGYNETMAIEHFPLTKEEALAQGFQWSDYVSPLPQVERIIKAAQLPDLIDQIPDDILNWAIECEISGKPFRVIKQELQFYRDHHLPVPRRHPDVRNRDRMVYRNPRKLFNRTCGKCAKAISSTYSPDRPEKVFCDECYLKEVY